MADSLEYKTVLSCFDKLVTALKLDPVAVSNELVAKGLIPPVDGAVDAQKLAQLLLDSVKLSPKRYYEIKEVFSGHECLGVMVDILQEEYVGKVTVCESVSVGVQTLGDEEVCSKGMSTLSISMELSKPMEGEETESKSEPSISPEGASEIFNTLFDFPHERSSLIPNPIVRFEKLTEDDRKDLSAQMDEMQDKICNTFAKVSDQVYESLKRRVQPDRVVLTLTKGSDLFDKDDVDRLHEATNVREVFKIMDPHYSYFNHDPLKLLVDVHGTSEDKKCFDEYLKSFASYCQAMPCAEEICGSDDSRPNRVKIKFKLDFDRQRLKADYVKDNIIRNIARILKIKPSSLYLCSIKEGCVSLEFLVPAFLFDRIFPLTDDQIVSLYSEVKVTAIHCDQRKFHVDVETLAQPLIQEKEFKSALKDDIGSTSGSQATSGGVSSSGYSSGTLSSRYSSGYSSGYLSGHSSSASPMGYPLMKPPKEFLHFPEEYQRAYNKPRSDPPLGHRLHGVEERRAASLAHYPIPPHAGSTDTGSTTSSAASSGYFSSASSMGSGYQVMKIPERFDYASFTKRLLEEKRRDPQWKQLGEEFGHHEREWQRLCEEVVQLGRQKNKVKDKESKKDIELKLKLKRLERDLAHSKRYKAIYQRQQRGSELERDLLSQELKTATNDVMKIKIQHRLKRAEGKIHEWKEEVNECERQVNQREESLAKLRGESHPTGSAGPLPSKLSPGGEGYDDTSLLKTVPSISITSPPASSSSPATADYTCPSCGVQYQGDKGLYSGEERCASCRHGSDGGKQQTN